jgi:hypothetical protein
MTTKVQADWDPVEQLYGQLTNLVEQQRPIKPNQKKPLPKALSDVAGSLAKYLSRVLAHYDAAEGQFCEDVFRVMRTIDHSRLDADEATAFKQLYLDERLNDYDEYNVKANRRRPKPFEATIETCRRLITLNEIRRSLRDLQTGAILGGSVSYGRFFNVKGKLPPQNESSDMDVMLVLPRYSGLSDVISRLTRVPGINERTVAQIAARIDEFLKLAAEHPTIIFSHKVPLWDVDQDALLKSSELNGQFFLSLHVFDIPTFDWMVLKDQARLEAEKNEFSRELLDFRNTDPRVRSYNQRSFSGLEFEGHDLTNKKYSHGFLTEVEVCLIRDDRYCPGLHQNLILPQFEVRWETEDVQLRLKVLSFRWKIIERLRRERNCRRFEEQNISLSHVRYDVFAPHVIRRANRE